MKVSRCAIFVGGGGRRSAMAGMASFQNEPRRTPRSGGSAAISPKGPVILAIMQGRYRMVVVSRRGNGRSEGRLPAVRGAPTSHVPAQVELSARMGDNDLVPLVGSGPGDVKAATEVSSAQERFKKGSIDGGAE